MRLAVPHALHLRAAVDGAERPLGGAVVEEELERDHVRVVVDQHEEHLRARAAEGARGRATACEGVKASLRRRMRARFAAHKTARAGSVDDGTDARFRCLLRARYYRFCNEMVVAFQMRRGH